jgi:hypothetical protein
MGIENFKRELADFKPSEDNRPLRDIDMTRRSEKPEGAEKQNPDSGEETSSSA